MKVYIVTTTNGDRRWHAEDAEHAQEQHEDAFGGDQGETIFDIIESGATIVKHINLTPTWEGILPALLAIIANGETVEARKTAEQELRRMARLSDAYVADSISQAGQSRR